MHYYIKNLGIIICTLYGFMKITYNDKDNGVKTFIISNIYALVSVILDSYVSFITFPVMVILMYFYILISNHKKGIIWFVIVIIAFAISYVDFELSAIIASLIMYPIPMDKYGFNDQIICLIVQCVIIKLLFSFKRTKKGMPFLNKQIYLIPFGVISFFVLIMSVFLNSNKFDFKYMFWSVILFGTTFIIMLFWHVYITRSYIERNTIRDIDTLNIALSKSQSRIDELTADNERMGHILHRDKKLVSAMENDVEIFMKDFLNYLDEVHIAERLSEEQKRIIYEFKERGSKILDDLHEMARGREGMITDQERSAIKLPKTNNSSVDRLFNYMQSKAYDNDISFQLTLDKTIKDFDEIFKNAINNEDFCTLLADLIDNAIIASKYNQGKQIMVNISRVSDDTANVFDKMKYNPRDIAVHIFDSGIPFTKEVLMKYGLEPITTHADDEGSGLGLMKTYEILNKCGASLFIHEFSADNGLYTKEITVVFNRKHQYLIYTGRSDDEIAYIRKRADVTVVKR